MPKLLGAAVADRIYNTELGLPIVGTIFDCFNFRQLKIAHGQPLTMRGDCVLQQGFVWESVPEAESVAKLKVFEKESLVFEPCGNLPEANDYLQRMRHNIDNLAKAYK